MTTIHEKYISVLEERVSLAQELGKVNGDLRDALDKLAASESLVGILRDEIEHLKSQLAAATATTESGSASDTRYFMSTVPGTTEFPASTNILRNHALASGVFKPLDKVASVHGSTFYADVQPLPLKRTRTQQQQLSTSSIMPAALHNQSTGSLSNSTNNNSKTILVTESIAKKPKLDNIAFLANARSHRSSNTSTPPQNSPKPTSATVKPVVIGNVDDHVKKEGTGKSRIVTCVYCENVVTSRNRSRWERHIRTCAKVPKSVKALFDPNVEPSDASSSSASSVSGSPSGSESSSSPSEDEEDEDHVPFKGQGRRVISYPPGGASSSSSNGTSILDLKDAINDHVLKTGMGIGRKVYCNHCKQLIPSNNKLKWMRHMNACQHCPSTVKMTFGKVSLSSGSMMSMGAAAPQKGSMPTGAGSTTTATTASTTVTTTSTARRPLARTVVPEPTAKPAAPIPPVIDTSANIYPKLEYPIEPHEFLADGSPNVERWRAWTDILRFQIPEFQIIPATGVRVTKFKRRHGVTEQRLVPQFGSKQHHSSVTFGIPERLHFQFLQFMDPTYRPDVVFPDANFTATPDSAKPPAKQAFKPLRIIVREELPGETENVTENLEAEITSGVGDDEPPLKFDALTEESVLPLDPSPTNDKIPGKTKYISLIKQVVPDYQSLSLDSRKAVKRGVKKYLELVLPDTFAEECVLQYKNGKTYVVPDRVLEDFKNSYRTRVTELPNDKMEEEAYKIKYIKSLEERLVSAEKLRTEELRAAQLRQDVLILARQAKLLRLRLAASDKDVPPPVVLSQYASVLTETEDDEDLAALLQVDEDLKNDLAEYGQSEEEATPWHLIFRKLYPGQISHLRPHHRQLIDAAIHEEFLIPRVGREASEKLLIRTSGAASYYAIPSPLLQEFNEWFTIKMDELIVSDEFSMKNSRRKSAPIPSSSSSTTSTVPPPKQVLSTDSSNRSRRTTISHLESEPQSQTQSQPPFKKPTPIANNNGGCSSNNKTKPQQQLQQQLSTDVSVSFSIPCRPTMPDGSPNAEGYRTWTDVIRSKYPTFNKSGSQMCKVAGSFCDKYKIKKIPMVAQTSFRSSKPAFALPLKYHKEFLEYMDAAFLQPDGTFGRDDAHLYPGGVRKPKSSTANEALVEEEEEEEDEGDGVASVAGSTKLEGGADVELGSSRISFARRVSLASTNSAAVAGSSTIAQVSSPTRATSVSTTYNAWNSALTEEQRTYLKENAKSTALLLRVRNQVLDFIKTHSGQAVDVVPDSLVQEFRCWFSAGIERGFGGGEIEASNNKDDKMEVEASSVLESMESLKSFPSESALSGIPEPSPADVATAAGVSENVGSVSPGRKQARRSPEAPDTAAKRIKLGAENVGEAADAVSTDVPPAQPSDVEVRRASMDYHPSSKFVTQSGMRLTKYNSILVKLMPDFKSLSREARVAIKRGVKLFLQQEMGDHFSECMFTADGADHHTYGVPDHLLEDFKAWYGQFLWW
ncbi:UNVERIFIED_CONTAM: hypothetical protein HDU68_008640 [Siphonaria sp. JEL0065]|nr:hypothetical protein HDU68_008640 [Siphonaria sp. JEL0065]